MNKIKHEIVLTLPDSAYAELKLTAKNLGVTPERILLKFIDDLLEETREANTAQRWFWLNRDNFRRRAI